MILARLTLSCFVIAVFNTSCGKSGGEGDAANVEGLVSEFSGLESLNQADDNSWIVRWIPLDLNGIVYAVFSARENETFNFDQPVVTTTEDIFRYTPENIFEENPTCFVVRVANYNGDDNENKKCTTTQPFVFSGIKTIERLSDGAYIVQWDAIPLKSTIYAIYESSNGDPYNFDLPSFDAIRDNFFKTPVINRGTKICYIVRYSNSLLPDDENSTEVCTADEEPIEFSGITELVAKSSTEVTVTWASSITEGIVAYKIYQGSDFKEQMTNVAADKTSAVISGLVPGRQYSFGVRAIDQYQREDSNLKIRPIVMPFE